jgi:hypothetical protein
MTSISGWIAGDDVFVDGYVSPAQFAFQVRKCRHVVVVVRCSHLLAGAKVC